MNKMLFILGVIICVLIWEIPYIITGSYIAAILGVIAGMLLGIGIIKRVME